MTPGPYSGLTGNVPRDPATGALLVAGYGVELGRAEYNGANITDATSVYADITLLSLPLIVGARPVKVRFGCRNALNDTAGGSFRVRLLRDATVIGEVVGSSAAVNQPIPMPCEGRIAAGAGAVTVKAQFARLGATGIATLTTSVVGAPAWLEAMEC